MDLASRVLDLACEIQQIPAPTFSEAARAEFVRQRFSDERLDSVEIDSLGNVYARLMGSPGGSARAVLVTAHTDTVFPAGTPLTLERSADRITGPGIGDNSLGVAGLFGLIWALRETAAARAGDLWLVANTGEEGLGDLRGIRGVMDRLGPSVGATVVLEGMALGRIYHAGIAVRRYRIRVETGSGHSWHDFGRPSAVHTLMRIGARLTDLIVPLRPKTTFNIGMVEGGSSINTIAGDASLLLDLRSEDPAVLEPLASRVEEIAVRANTEAVRVTVELIGHRPAGHIPRVHPLVRLAARSLTEAGVEPVCFESSSTDANLPLSRGLPAVCVGLTRGGEAHSPAEYIESKPLPTGLDQLVRLARGCWELDTHPH